MKKSCMPSSDTELKGIKERQNHNAKSLAKNHLSDGSLFLTETEVEGRGVVVKKVFIDCFPPVPSSLKP